MLQSHPRRQPPLQMPQLDESRMNYQRLRRPTPLPTMTVVEAGLGRYLQRLNWLFGGQ